MCRMSLAIRRRGLSAMGKARPDLAAPNPQLLAARRGVPARLAADQAEQWDGADKFATGVDQRSHRPHGGGAASCSGQAKAKSHQMRYDTEPNCEATVPGRGGGLDAIAIALVQARPVPPPVTRLACDR